MSECCLAVISSTYSLPQAASFVWLTLRCMLVATDSSATRIVSQQCQRSEQAPVVAMILSKFTLVRPFSFLALQCVSE